ncbi:MAG: Rieske (2Fe-2S) protein [Verrucomicrobiales bacterium]|nr:Rieske (2Fe-2S) protein [Verrucomicrobiales bacterium]
MDVNSRSRARRLIATIQDLERESTAKFTFKLEGISRDGFVALFDGEVVAYENLCRHIPLTIDYGDNRFFTTDARHFVCQTHGAIYEPLSGLCVRGPCEGASLRKLEIAVSEGKIFLLEETNEIRG